MCMLWIRIPVIRSGLTAEKKTRKKEKKVLTKRRKAGILTERLTEGMKKQESRRKRPGGSRTDFRKRAEKSA